MHVHSIHATVLASLADSTLPPIDQNSAMFFNRHVVDDHYGGLAFEEEGERCSKLLADPKVKVMVMGNHGILVIGDNVADAFNRMFYFERAAETYIKALWTGRPLRTLSDEIAEKAAARAGRLSRPGRAASRRTEGDPRRAGAGLPELRRTRSPRPIQSSSSPSSCLHILGRVATSAPSGPAIGLSGQKIVFIPAASPAVRAGEAVLHHHRCRRDRRRSARRRAGTARPPACRRARRCGDTVFMPGSTMPTARRLASTISRSEFDTTACTTPIALQVAKNLQRAGRAASAPAHAPDSGRISA